MIKKSAEVESSRLRRLEVVAGILARMITRGIDLTPRYGERLIYVRKEGAIHHQALAVLALMKVKE